MDIWDRTMDEYFDKWIYGTKQWMNILINGYMVKNNGCIF